MNTYKQIFQNELNNIEKNGLLKKERALKTPQGTEIITESHKTAYNMCSNNYLGLAITQE